MNEEYNTGYISDICVEALWLSEHKKCKGCSCECHELVELK